MEVLDSSDSPSKNSKPVTVLSLFQGGGGKGTLEGRFRTS